MSIERRVIEEILKKEGGYVNDPKDSGGETHWGITKAVARKFGYVGRMRDMPRERAYGIYVKRYWNRLRCGEIEKLSPSLAEAVMDTGVNMGVGRAGEFLQRALNLLNNEAKSYDDIVVDGWIGAETLRALDAYFKARGTEGEEVLLKMLNALKGAFYITLAERRSKDERFVYGWFKHRVA